MGMTAGCKLSWSAEGAAPVFAPELLLVEPGPFELLDLGLICSVGLGDAAVCWLAD